jgi:hypothetical protein
MNVIVCKDCKKTADHHGKGLCYSCYKKAWKPKSVICKNCNKEKPHQAKGMCKNCFNKVFRYQYIKDFNYKKYHNIDPVLYKKITEKCKVCGFDKIINLHHLDHDRKNNIESNIIGLCPNHHKLINDHRYSQEVVDALKKKGIDAKLTKL